MCNGVDSVNKAFDFQEIRVMSTRMEAGSLTCNTSIEKLRIEEEEEEEEERKTMSYLKNTTALLLQEIDELKKASEEQKQSQLQTNVTITRLERELEVLQKNSKTQ